MSNLHRSQVHDALKHIPKEKWTTKVRQAITGLGILAFAGLAATKFGFPWYATLGVAAVGGHIISGDIRRALKSFGVATVKDAVDSVKGARP